MGSNFGEGIILLMFFFMFFFCHYYHSANSTLLSLLRFSYFITPYDAQASSACSALILEVRRKQDENQDHLRKNKKSPQNNVSLRENIILIKKIACTWARSAQGKVL